MKLGLGRDWDAFSCHFPRGFKWPRPWNQILKSGLERQSTGGKLWENYGKPGKTMENYGSFHVLLLFLFIVFVYVLFFCFRSPILFQVHFPKSRTYGGCISHSQRNDKAFYWLVSIKIIGAIVYNINPVSQTSKILGTELMKWKNGTTDVYVWPSALRIAGPTFGI